MATLQIARPRQRRSAGTAQLNVGARQVWAGAATDDPIASPGTAIPYVGKDVHGAMYLGHNMQPQQPAFGGNVYHVDTQSHSGNWTPGSHSLKNQADVVTGALVSAVAGTGNQLPIRRASTAGHTAAGRRARVRQ